MTTASPQRTLWLAAGGVLAVLFTLWAGFTLIGWTVGSVSKREHHAFAGAVHRVQIDGALADVTLLPSSGQSVTVDSVAKGSLWLPKMRARMVGDHVTVEGHCHWALWGGCGASFVIRVPAGAQVDLATDSGDVRVSGLTGKVDIALASGDLELDGLTGQTTARVDSGDIQARRMAGRAVLFSSSGDIDATDMTADEIRARTDSGDVFVDAARSPDSVTAETSSGDATISVPRGETYATHLETSSGDRRLNIAGDPAAPRSLTAVTSSGDAMIRYR